MPLCLLALNLGPHPKGLPWSFVYSQGTLQRYSFSLFTKKGYLGFPLKCR